MLSVSHYKEEREGGRRTYWFYEPIKLKNKSNKQNSSIAGKLLLKLSPTAAAWTLFSDMCCWFMDMENADTESSSTVQRLHILFCTHEF